MLEYKTRSGKDRIALVWTGGTIASGEGKNGLAPSLTAQEFLGMVPSRIKEPYKIHSYIPHGIDERGIDSTENSVEIMESVRSLVYQLLTSDPPYAGVIIGHGTDTLTNTAQYLAFSLQELPAPVVFTGSQFKPSHPRTDAFRNFSGALAVATSNLAEVVVSFGDRVHRAVACQKVNGKDAEAFSSPHQKHLAEFDREEVHISSIARPRPERGDLKNYPGLADIDSSILRLTALTSGRAIEKILSVHDALILEGFGEGNVPVYRERLRERLAIASRLGKHVLIAPQCASGESPIQYAVSAHAHPEAIFAKGMVSSCAQIKLHWLLAQAARLDKKIPPFLRKGFALNFVGEFPENGQHHPPSHASFL